METSSDILHLGAPLSAARVVCVFVHGRGQSPEVMQVDILSHLTTPDVAYLLPRAAGGSWYAARAVDALTDETRSALARSLEILQAVMAPIRAADLPILLAGFSQGACLSLEYTFAQGPWAGALAAFTGCRVGIPSDTRPACDFSDMPVYLTGSDADPWIPLSAFAEATAALGAARARLRADLFPGRAHLASAPEIAVLDGMLADLAARRPVTMEAAR